MVQNRADERIPELAGPAAAVLSVQTIQSVDGSVARHPELRVLGCWRQTFGEYVDLITHFALAPIQEAEVHVKGKTKAVEGVSDKLVRK